MTGSQCFQRYCLGSHGWSRETEALHGCVCDLVSVSSRPTLGVKFSSTDLRPDSVDSTQPSEKRHEADFRSAADVITDSDNWAPSWRRKSANWVARRPPPTGCLHRSVKHLLWDTDDMLSTWRCLHGLLWLRDLLKWNHVGCMWVPSRGCTFKYSEKGEH